MTFKVGDDIIFNRFSDLLEIENISVDTIVFWIFRVMLSGSVKLV